MINNIPQELKQNNQWVLHSKVKSKYNPKGKTPLQSNGEPAKVNDSSTWLTFNNAKEFLNNEIHNNEIHGIAHVFSMNDNLICFDIDNLNIETNKKESIIKVINSYTELSQSENGYHVIARVNNKQQLVYNINHILNYNTKTGTCKCGDYELFVSNKCCWMTGNVVNNVTAIRVIEDDELLEILKLILVEKVVRHDEKAVFNTSPRMNNETILALCNKAKNSEKFKQLWNTQGVDGNSESDQALLNILSFYTQDIDQLCALMRSSPRNRDKFDRDDYLIRTANKSIDSLETTYNPKFKDTKKVLEWDKDFITIDKNNNIYPKLCSNNLKILLKYRNDIIKYNQMSKKVEFNGEEINNNVDTLIYEECMRYKFKNLNEGLIPKMLNKIAHENIYHPVKDFLDNLIPINSTKELDKMFGSLEFAEDFNIELGKEIYYKWLLMAVDAIYNNNFKGQGVLTLQGTGGIGKSTWLEKLIPNVAWFNGESIGFDVNNKDKHDKVTSTWITELAELESTFKKDYIALKGFLVSEFDSYRLPYERRTETYKRRTVFAASVNSKDFLRDDTGDRRFWILEIEDIDWDIVNIIDLTKLWAEVLYMYKKQTFKMDKTFMNKIKKLNLNYKIRTPLEDCLYDLIDIGNTLEANLNYYSSQEILIFLKTNNLKFGLDLKQLTTTKIGQILNNMGFKSKNCKPEGKIKKARYYKLALNEALIDNNYNII